MSIGATVKRNQIFHLTPSISLFKGDAGYSINFHIAYFVFMIGLKTKK